MDFVWLMSKGEDYEGGSVIGVHATEAGARAEAQAFIQQDLAYGVEWKLHREEPDRVIWRDGGCAWLEIKQTRLLS